MSLQEFTLTVIGLCALLALAELVPKICKPHYIYDPTLDADERG